MSKYDYILAKSPENGGTTLESHLKSTAYFAKIAAEYAGMDVDIAEKGALLHDIGKTSPLFQKKLHGHRPSPVEMSFRHEIASLFFLKIIDSNIWPQIIDMIVAHHKSTAKDLRELGILDLDRNYGEEAFNHHISGFEQWKVDALGILVELGFPETIITKQDAYESYQYAVKHCKSIGKGWSVWKGLLMGADHMASATSDFQEQLPTLFTTPDVHFYNRENELYPLSLIKSDSQKKHTFVKAPTGAGKTDFLLKRCHGRIFYTLPFQASINAMYKRIQKDLNGCVDDIRLLHSISQLVIEGDHVVEEKAIQDKFGAAIKILTPHQLASIALGTRGYEAILFDLRGCDIILDEIHTYSDMMQSIVLKIVQVLKNVGCRIHVGTATMPTVLEKAILKILGDDDVQYIELPKKVLDSFNRHIVHKSASFESLLPVVQEAVNNGQKILIVCNRVANAQILFERMQEIYPSVKKMLIHSRFKRKDRNHLEMELKNVYNTSTNTCIVVSTQVVEVSLDISFDVMITEAAPIDAMIQRFGRINRIRNTETIGKYKHVYVTAPPQKKSECLPYSLDILQCSYNVLPDNALLEESALQSLIDKVYPQIEFTDIDLDAVFVDNQWRLRELWHLPKSALIERLDINSVSCITQSDEENYSNLNGDERILMEIPVSYNSVRWKNLDQVKIGSHPFIIPDAAYTSKQGLDLKKSEVEHYDTNYQIL
jgi:CRISPR-associated endonuclease/helicase Cas3